MEENSINFSMQDVMRLAGTPAGQKLLDHLHKKNEKQLQMAIAHAVSGNWEQAKQLLSGLINDPEAQKLIRELGGSHGGNG